MIRFFVVLILAMVSVTLARPPDKRCQDSSDNHKFASSRSCQRYMMCHEGRVTQHNCETGEMFDQKKEECVKVHCPKCDCDAEETHHDDNNSKHEDKSNDKDDKCFQRICRPCKCSRRPSSKRERPSRRSKGEDESNHEPKQERSRSRSKKGNLFEDIKNKHVPISDKKGKSIADQIKSHAEEHVSIKKTDEHHLKEHDLKSDKTDHHDQDDRHPKHQGKEAEGEESPKASPEHHVDEPESKLDQAGHPDDKID